MSVSLPRCPAIKLVIPNDDTSNPCSTHDNTTARCNVRRAAIWARYCWANISSSVFRLSSVQTPCENHDRPRVSVVQRKSIEQRNPSRQLVSKFVHRLRNSPRPTTFIPVSTFACDNELSTYVANRATCLQEVDLTDTRSKYTKFHPFCNSRHPNSKPATFLLSIVVETQAQ